MPESHKKSDKSNVVTDSKTRNGMIKEEGKINKREMVGKEKINFRNMNE